MSSVVTLRTCVFVFFACMSAQEIARNYVWLKPVCANYPRNASWAWCFKALRLDAGASVLTLHSPPSFPAKVPSAFLLTDALLLLDEMLSFGLLMCDKDETRDIVAGREAKRMKKCLGALRSLYRSSVLFALR